MAETQPTARAAKDGAEDLKARAATAAHAAREAKRAEEEAHRKAKEAADAMKAAQAEFRAEALGGAKDSCPKGTVDLGPELRLPDAELVAKIGAGKLDGVLSELLGMVKVHPRLKPDGSFAERGTVIAALEARLKRA
jgi:hypothetical protein